MWFKKLYEEESEKDSSSTKTKEEKQKEAIDTIISTYKTNHVTYGSMYILPNGIMLDLGNSEYGHAIVSDYLNECGVEIDYEIGRASKLLKSLGWIRINTKLRFIDFTNSMFTDAQEEKLKDAIGFMKTDIEVTVLGNSKVYRNVTPEYIIEWVKQCYTFGVLHEEK